jgi:hypothetical protein
MGCGHLSEGKFYSPIIYYLAVMALPTSCVKKYILLQIL